MSDETVKYTLPESEIPTHWVNLLPDLPGDPIPPLNPQTQQPAGPDDLWWQPAYLGGAAPTPEEATRLDHGDVRGTRPKPSPLARVRTLVRRRP